jgi:uncharacterized protein (TIGR00251 family)
MEVISNAQNGETMEVYSCIQNTLDGDILLDIEVQPESKRSGITGFNKWRDRLSVAVTAPAKDGKANIALIHVLSKTFELEKSSIEIISGHTSRMKRIKIMAKDTKQIIDIIMLKLGE